MTHRNKKLFQDNKSVELEERTQPTQWIKFMEKLSIKSNNSPLLSQQSCKSANLLVNQKITQNYSLFLEKIKDLIESDEDRKQLLLICNQRKALSFRKTFSKNSYENLVRLGRGSYAEVFRGYDKNSGQLVVFKVIRALSYQIKSRVSGPVFKSIVKLKDITSEFSISSALSDLNNKFIDKYGNEYQCQCFPLVFQKYLVDGDIPEYLRSEQISDNLTPIRDEPFEDFVDIPREHAIIVMSFGGQPLWKAIKNRDINGAQMLSVIKQICFGLGIAETVFEFEHRDLHFSNILLKNTDKTFINFILRSLSYPIESLGYEAVIIDTTFSRIKIGKNIYFKEMRELLKYKPSDKLTPQDRIYKRMAQLTKNDWKQFCPKTNINWINYIFRLIYNSSIMNEFPDPQPKAEIRKMSNVIIHCKSVEHFLKEYFKV